MHKITELISFQNIIILLFGLVLFLLPIFNIQLFHDSFVEGKQFLLQIIIPFLFTLILIEIVRGNITINYFPCLTIPFVLLFILSLLSISRAYNHLIALETLFKLTCIGSIYFIPFILNFKKRGTEFVILSIFFSSLLVLIYSIVKIEIIGKEPILKYFGEEALSIREGLTFGNPNFYAQFLILIIPLGYYFLRSYSSIILKIAFLFISLSNIYIFFQEKAVGAWISFLISCLLIIVIEMKKKFRTKKLLNIHNMGFSILTIIIIFICIITFLGIFQDISNLIIPQTDLLVSLKDSYNTASSEITNTFMFGTNKSSSYRYSLWQKSVQIIRDSNGFGIGLNNFQFILPNYWDYEMLQKSEANFFVPTEQTENEYLQVTTELGIVGLLLFLWMVIRISKLLLISLHCEEEKSKYLFLSLSVGIVGILLYSLVSFPLQSPISASLFWLFVGIVENNLKQYKEPIGEKASKMMYLFNKVLPILVSILTAYLIVSSIYFTPKQISGSYYYKEGINRFRYGQSHADVMLARAKSNRPYHFLTRYYLGEVYLSRGFFDEAVDEFNHAVILGNYHRAFNQLASIYTLGNNKERALENYIKSIKVYPCNEKILQEAGDLAMRLEKWNDAYFIFTKYIQIASENIEVQKNLAKIEFARGEYKIAKSLFSALKNKIPDSIEIVKNLIAISIKLNEYQNADKYLEEYSQMMNTPEEKLWYDEQIKIISH